MNLRSAILVIILCFFSKVSNAQGDYYITPGEMNYGIDLVKGSDRQNARFVCVRNDNKVKKLFPGEVVEYGYKTGQVYKLKVTDISNTPQKFFLEVISKGRRNIYFLNDEGKKSFFAEDTSGNLQRIVSKSSREEGNNFNDQLASLTADCNYISSSASLVSYNKASIRRFFDMYNTYDHRPFPFFKFGIIAGYEFTRYNPTNQPAEYLYFNLFSFKPNGAPFIGIFLDKPLPAKNLSIHLETIIASHTVTDQATLSGKTYDIKLKSTGVTIPLMFRYSYPLSKVQPFANAGLTYSYNFINSNTLIENNSLDLSNQYEIVPDELIGFSIGAGTQIKISNRNSVFLELRFTQQYGMKSFEYVNISDLSFSTGFNF